MAKLKVNDLGTYLLKMTSFLQFIHLMDMVKYKIQAQNNV